MRAREASTRRGCAHLFVQHAQVEEVATCPGGTPRKLTPPCPPLVAAVGAGLSAHAGARRNTGAGDFLRCPVERIGTAPGVMMHSPLHGGHSIRSGSGFKQAAARDALLGERAGLARMAGGGRLRAGCAPGGVDKVTNCPRRGMSTRSRCRAEGSERAAERRKAART